MSTVKIPNPMERRHLIEKEQPPEKSLAIADAYLEEGRASEAIAFLIQAGAEDRLQGLVEKAVTDGDAFLLRQVTHESEIDVSSGTWLKLAEAAEKAGKARHAETARRFASRDSQ